MKRLRPLQHDKLCQKTDPDHFNFETTQEIHELTEFVGQSRAVEAVQFGIGIQGEGYNLFAMGPSGIGKRSIIYTVLEAEAFTQPIPPDWCYVYNFSDPQKPIALQLPPGIGSQLCQDMQTLMEDIGTSIPVIFEGEEYHSRLQKITDELNNQQEALLQDINEDAEKHGLIIFSTPETFTVSPVNEKGEAITTEEFDKFPKKIREEKEKLIATFSRRLANFLKEVPRLHKEQRHKEKELKKEFTLIATGPLIHDLKKKYKKFSAVVQHLNAIQNDIVQNIQDFLKREEAPAAPFAGTERSPLFRYQVNVLVDNSVTKGAPIIYEENPSYSNLICRIEHVVQFGTLSTDFTLIKAGALQTANGGYLIIDTAKLLQEPLSWDALKRALYSREIHVEMPEPATGALSTESLDPMPIPLSIKIILLGDRVTHYLLCELDPDFDELFKVAVDFEDHINRSPDNLQLYARLIATLAKKQQLRPFRRAAVAAIIDYSARLSEDAERLSTHMRSINDLMREANYWAEKAGRDIIEKSDIKQAIDAKTHRLDRIRETSFEDIYRQIILIDVHGEKIGQINGLVVMQLGSFNFGYPVRITARIRFGDGQVIDIQREAEMAGPLHSKGVLILSGFLASRYIKDYSFSLSASLVFEQTYSMVEGDSASVAELCALLSALADLPIKQSLAVTGSINQMGDIQAVGSINEKIEGFFDICNATGLTGKQGVIIPAINAKHLMLKDEVVAACAAKKFHIYPVKTIDETITLLTGVPAGKRNRNGRFTRGSVNERVEHHLELYAKKARKRRKPTPKKKPKKSSKTKSKR